MRKPAREDAAPALSLVDPRAMDPEHELVMRSHLSDEQVDQTVAVLEAMSRWRELERSLSEQARRYMRLGDTDMRALRFLIAAQRQGVPATPGSVAAHLGISPAAATKLIDRLEAGGHIRRGADPDDRRRTVIEVTESTRTSARASVGRSHARRFDAVAGLSPADRRAVLRFFDALMDSAEWGEPEAPEHG
jgi:DNA-binding MarR family transcriptional regulator